MTAIRDMLHKKKDTIKEKRKVSSGKHPFIKYIDDNIEDVFKTFHTSFMNTPYCTNNLDERFVKSEILTHAMIENLTIRSKKMFQLVNNDHHDVLFDNKYRISLKSQSIIFQRFSRGIIRRPSKPRPIILKNCLSSKNKGIENDNWDYLLAIQPQNEDQNIKLSFGIMHFNSIKKFIVDPDGSADQVRIKLNNIDWEYFYVSPEFFPEYTESERHSLNKRYQDAKRQICTDLLKNNGISLI
jgi:hypothetical protein